MKCLVKIYDTEQVNNLISILAFKPQKVIFLYDKKYTEIEDLVSIEKTCSERISDINFEFLYINTQDLDDIKNKCKKVIRAHEECFFDITGGEELSVIGMYLSCIKSFVPIFKLDIDSGKIVNVYGCNTLAENFTMPELDLSTILSSKGAIINSNFHPTPNDIQFNAILPFCNIIFDNIAMWKELCTYTQNGMKSLGTQSKSLKFHYAKNSEDTKTKLSENSEKLLLEAENLQLINSLEINPDNIKFNFVNDNIRRYMTDFGSWLELYSYITLRQSGLFKDIKMSVKISWDGANGNKSDVINEIDVTFFSGITPVFLSCKLSEPNTEALQELSIYPSYFGGRRSKCILVSAANIRIDKPNILNRAHEMGIHIIDKTDIKSGKFIEKVRKIVGLKD